MLQLTLSDRAKYKNLLEEEKHKTNPDPRLIEEYDTRQIGAKLFANAGYGLFGNEHFEFANYKVAECITAEGRRILKHMAILAHSEVVFGFTDSVFFKDVNVGVDAADTGNFFPLSIIYEILSGLWCLIPGTLVII